MIGAREAALLSLNDIFYNGKYSNLAVKEMLNKCRGMDKNEKALYTNLVYGVVSRHYTLEYVIGKYSSIKVKKLARYVNIILQMGMYQLLYLDKIPQSAAVNECVKLTKKYCKKGSDRFVNAVLRALCKDDCKITIPENDLATKHSFSNEMTEMFIDQFGFEFADKLMEALNSTADITIRPNILKTDIETLSDKLDGIGVKNSITEYGLIATQGFDVSNNDLYINGYFTPQDRGAYEVSLILAPKKGEKIIDMCAAPGGKSTHIAELMGNIGEIISFDIHEHKTKLIKSAAKRLGVSIIDARVSDSTVFDSSYTGFADRVLCDVPCSGWGIIRKKPDIKLSHTDLDELYIIQAKILENAAKYVKSGGCVVYSTCTLNRRENEDIITNFLSTHNEFEKTYEKTFYPQLDDSDGFFICRLEKK